MYIRIPRRLRLQGNCSILQMWQGFHDKVGIRPMRLLILSKHKVPGDTAVNEGTVNSISFYKIWMEEKTSATPNITHIAN